MLLTRLGMPSMSRITITPTFTRKPYALACSVNVSSMTDACINSSSRATTHITPQLYACIPFSVHIQITQPLPWLPQPTHKLPNTSNNKSLTSQPNYGPYTTHSPSSSWEISNTQSLTTPFIVWASIYRYHQLTSLHHASIIPLI